ncbi:hypothetical protein ACFRCG_39800 [Embleya sp. NPDC056575]|uniref:hypothetical protein n=1 Tax=unclassified Embleya TaxID=2699296 RepID=UPI0036C4EDCA
MASQNRILRLITRGSPPRRVPPASPPRDTVTPRPPLWVRAFTAAGRPAVAVTVLVMCAPGEHHLAVLAGWDTRLAWGMAAVLAAYAGIAAVVAGTRPRGAPGHRSAVAGAALSLGLAMSAQPVSHMFVTGHWTATPAAPVWLVWVVSCIPPLVLGHLLHLAATPVQRQVERRVTAVTADATAAVTPPPPAAPAHRPAIHGPAAIPLSVPVVVTPRVTAAAPQRELTTAMIAERFKVKPNTVRQWVARGTLVPLPERDANGGYLFAPDATPKLTVATG